MKLWHWAVLSLAVVALAAFIPAARAGAPGLVPRAQQLVSRVITVIEGATPTPAVFEFRGSLAEISETVVPPPQAPGAIILPTSTPAPLHRGRPHH
jgi:hypothetical protein